MAGVTVDNANLTFISYLDGVVETLNQESKSRNLIKQNNDWTGTHIEFRINSARNPALGYMEDGGAFPAADKMDYQTAKVFRKFVGGSIQITDGAMANASKGKNVVKSVVDSEVDGLMKGLLKVENGMFFRNGDGTVATVKTGTTGTTLLVDDARMLWDKGTFAVYNSTLATNRGTLTVSKTASARTAAGYATVTTTATVPSGTTDTDKLVWQGTNMPASSLNRAITGLDKLVDDAATTFQNINVDTYPRYSSLVLDNSGTNRSLEPNLFRAMLAGIAQKSGSERPSQGLKVLCSTWQAINVEELYEGEMRVTPDTKTVGMAVASFQTALGRVDIMTDPDAPYNKMFFIDPSKIYRGTQKKLHWRKEEGGGIFKRSDTAGVYTATALEIADLYIKERTTSGKIEDLSETISTSY